MAKKGFTLIELLVVVSVIGVLSALILANFNTARERARDVQRKSDLDQIKKALRLYYNDQSPTTIYPATGTLVWGSPFQSGNMIYMKSLPRDPSYNPATGNPNYSYQMNDTNGQDFCLWTTLENTADPEAGKSQARCTTACAGVSFSASSYAACAD